MRIGEKTLDPILPLWHNCKSSNDNLQASMEDLKREIEMRFGITLIEIINNNDSNNENNNNMDENDPFFIDHTLSRIIENDNNNNNNNNNNNINAIINDQENENLNHTQTNMKTGTHNLLGRDTDVMSQGTSLTKYSLQQPSINGKQYRKEVDRLYADIIGCCLEKLIDDPICGLLWEIILLEMEDMKKTLC